MTTKLSDVLALGLQRQKQRDNQNNSNKPSMCFLICANFEEAMYEQESYDVAKKEVFEKMRTSFSGHPSSFVICMLRDHFRVEDWSMLKSLWYQYYIWWVFDLKRKGL